MAGPTTTTWHVQPHTLAKHAILRRYLQAWFPILASAHNRLVYYDGFAGPGVYDGGEIGSPIIALNVARTHRAKLGSELVFAFVESHEKRADRLTSEITALKLPSNFKWTVVRKDFEIALCEILDRLDERGLQIAPTFALVDPFGIKGLPFKLIERLLARKRCEVLITFMNTTIQRFVMELPDQVNELIGNPHAAERIAKCKAGKERVIAARRLYEDSLRRVAKFVRFFGMKDQRNVEIYDLFFASNSPDGHYRMKEAMWKVDDTGDYSFSDGVDPNQATLFGADPVSAFAPVLWTTFRGRTVYSEEVREYTRDESPYLEKHARAALMALERDGGVGGKRMVVDNDKRDRKKRRRGTYPDGTRITFVG